MSSQNETMTLRGFDIDTQLCDLKRDQPFSDMSTGKHYGMPISTCKFLEMLFRFWVGNPHRPDNPFKDVWWVNFSKASIFRILAQEDCEYIRFYFAIPEEGINEASLALEGVDANHNPINLPQILAVAGTMTGEDDQDPESPGAGITILQLTDGTNPPNNEEKGNGGPPLEDNLRNISSLIEFTTTFEHSFKETVPTFQEFIQAYYENAQKNFS
jgi:hypothetical protein